MRQDQEMLQSNTKFQRRPEVRHVDVKRLAMFRLIVGVAEDVRSRPSLMSNANLEALPSPSPSPPSPPLPPAPPPTCCGGAEEGSDTRVGLGTSVNEGYLSAAAAAAVASSVGGDACEGEGRNVRGRG